MKTIRTQITRADYRAFQRHAMFRYRKMHWIFGFLACLLGLSSWFGGKPDEKVSQKIYILIGTLMLWGLICVGIFLVMWIVRRIGLSRFKPMLGEHLFEITPNGLRETTVTSQVDTQVAGIARVDETKQHVFVITTSGLGHIIRSETLMTLRYCWPWIRRRGPTTFQCQQPQAAATHRKR